MGLTLHGRGGAYEHECNAYCHDGVHADVHYSSIPEKNLAKHYAEDVDEDRMRVLDVRPAPEAPPIEVRFPWLPDRILKQCTHRYLVIFQWADG